MRAGLYWWWDDAIHEAQQRAVKTGRRYRVRRAWSFVSFGFGWQVSEVDV